MRAMETTCDVCGRKKGEATGWLLALTHVASQGIAFQPSDSQVAITPGAEIEDLCGARCAHARLDQHFESLGKSPSLEADHAE